jgi:hypothetical protein
MSNAARVRLLGRIVAHLVREASPEAREIAIPLKDISGPLPDLGIDTREIEGEMMVVLAVGDDPK